MAGTSVGITTFVLGKENEGNRQTATFTNGQSYDLDFSDAQAYSSGETSFPYVAE